jgi:hypothetical protein
MGNINTNCINGQRRNNLLVLQTGNLRKQCISNGVRSLDKSNTGIGLGIGVVHAWLPTDLESTYEAFDFTEKFGLSDVDYIDIHNDNDNLIKLCKPNDILQKNIYEIARDIGSSKLLV